MPRNTSSGICGIAEALLRFETAVKSLPAEDQKELFRLLVREISVKHFDPNRTKHTAKKACSAPKIRTKWYWVNISLFASDLIQDGCKSGEISSDLKGIGSRGRARTYNFAVNSRALYH